MEITQIDKQIIEALFAELDETAFAEITIMKIAHRADLPASQIYQRAGDINQLVCFVLDRLDDTALRDSAADFADAEDASIYEKLLEGLIHRFEVFAPYKSGFSALQRACFRRPDLGVALICQLHQTVSRLLSFCGDDDTGWRRAVRIKGVAGVIMKTGAVWLKDDTADLSQTINALDSELRRAEEWAISLRVLTPQPETGNHSPS